ncbi:unnamed protein product [Pleuronectes platessa]|uniref:Uncharacterized protein n=1 Tax=Pleuronectes platessa TaxID=8262 RepID=A0A9N7TRW6_PLEPL|nr:unnamed protein product [Pleuronectes platessa]
MYGAPCCSSRVIPVHVDFYVNRGSSWACPEEEKKPANWLLLPTVYGPDPIKPTTCLRSRRDPREPAQHENAGLKSARAFLRVSQTRVTSLQRSVTAGEAPPLVPPPPFSGSAGGCFP